MIYSGSVLSINTFYWILFRPDGKIVHPYAWKASAEYEEASVAVGGYYSVCLDNQFSKFAAKLVNLYITTFRYDEWEKFAQELQVGRNFFSAFFLRVLRFFTATFKLDGTDSLLC